MGSHRVGHDWSNLAAAEAEAAAAATFIVQSKVHFGEQISQQTFSLSPVIQSVQIQYSYASIMHYSWSQIALNHIYFL